MTNEKKTYWGHCQCAAVTFAFVTELAAEQLVPRACDCDFCRQRQISYMSDPTGEARINSRCKLTSLKQGSNQAEFLACADCRDVIAATEPNSKLCAINATLLVKSADFPSAQTVSPKALNAQQKYRRWQQIWMPYTITAR